MKMLRVHLSSRNDIALAFCDNGWRYIHNVYVTGFDCCLDSGEISSIFASALRG